MLFLFPVKDGKLSTGVIAIFGRGGCLRPNLCVREHDNFLRWDNKAWWPWWVDALYRNLGRIRISRS